MKQLSILGVGLLASLTLAYTVWTDDSEEVDPDAVALFDASEDSLTSITWMGELDTALIERRTDARGDYVWVTVTETVAVAQAADVDADADSDSDSDTGEAEPEPVQTEVRTISFKGGGQAEQVWVNFAPLLSLRELVGASSTESFGLEESTTSIEIVVDGLNTTLVVGGETYGSKDRYVSAGERIFLVDDRALRPLQFAKTRLVDRSLVGLDAQDISMMTVEHGADRLAWSHEQRDDRGQDFWAPVGNATERDEQAKTWLGKLLALRAQSFVDEVSLDVAMDPLLAFTVEGDDASWTVEIFRESGDVDLPTYYARSSWSRSMVIITQSLAQDAFADVDEFFGE